MSTPLRIVWIILMLLVLASIASNLYLINVAVDLQNQIDQATGTAGLALETAADQLGAVEEQEFTLIVPIDQEIPIDATIPFDEEFNIPIDLTVPINTTVAVPLELGLLGTFDLDIPINTTVPIDVDVPVRIQRDVPIQTVVPIRLDVPVTLSLRGTPMAAELAEWREIVLQLREDMR